MLHCVDFIVPIKGALISDMTPTCTMTLKPKLSSFFLKSAQGTVLTFNQNYTLFWWLLSYLKFSILCPNPYLFSKNLPVMPGLIQPLALSRHQSRVLTLPKCLLPGISLCLSAYKRLCQAFSSNLAKRKHGIQGFPGILDLWYWFPFCVLKESQSFPGRKLFICSQHIFALFWPRFGCI